MANIRNHHSSIPQAMPSKHNRLWCRINGYMTTLLIMSVICSADEASTTANLQAPTEIEEKFDPVSSDVSEDSVDSEEDPFSDVDWSDMETTDGDDDDIDWDFGDVELDETTIYRNWVTVGFQNTWVDGDTSAYQRRFKVPDGFAGGIESLHYEQDVNSRSRMAIDSRIMPGLEDYYFQLFFEDPEVGWFQAGFKQLRTWHDASGGYYPPSQTWVSPFDDEMYIDSGELWFEGGLTLPEKPVFTFGYRHQYRDGLKDSLVWGDSALIAGSSTPSVRGLIPSFRDIDEERHSFRLGVMHDVGLTRLDFGMRYDRTQSTQSLNTPRHPGEPLFDRKSTTTDNVISDLFNIHGSSVTKFSDQLQLGAGYGFTTLDNDVSGSRIFGDQYDALFDPVFQRRRYRDSGFLGLNGGSQLHQSVLNLNLFYRPWKNVAIIPSLRAERTSTESSNGFASTFVDPTLNTQQNSFWLDSERQYQELSERLELRYSGFQDWSLYARGRYVQGGGDLDEFLQGINPQARLTDDDRRTQKYTGGANWYPLSNLNFGFQYYHKIHDLNYDHDLDSTLNQFPSRDQFPAFTSTSEFTTDDINLRMTWRPVAKVTVVSRYDYQTVQVDNQAERTGASQDAKLRAHIISETITYQPWSQLYLQGGFSYTYDTTETASDSILLGGEPLIPHSRNNYWNANGTIGWAASQAVDLDLSYYYYRADNYMDNSAITMPYGADFKEHVIRFGIQYRLNPQTIWKSSYSFFRSEDITSGGNNSFDAHGIYTSIQYMF